MYRGYQRPHRDKTGGRPPAHVSGDGDGEVVIVMVLVGDDSDGAGDSDHCDGDGGSVMGGRCTHSTPSRHVSVVGPAPCVMGARLRPTPASCGEQLVIRQAAAGPDNPLQPRDVSAHRPTGDNAHLST